MPPQYRKHDGTNPLGDEVRFQMITLRTIHTPDPFPRRNAYYIFSKGPTQIMARALVAGACVLGGGAQAQQGQTLTAFGDSITYGYHASVPANDYINLVGAAKGWTVNDLGHSGDTLVDQAKVIYGTVPTMNSLSSLLIGQNDSCGAAVRSLEWGSNYEAVAAYLLTPNKWPGQDSRVVKTGTWTKSTQTPFGIQSSSDGSSASVVSSGSAFYVAYTATYGSAAVVTVTQAETGQTLAVFTPSAMNSAIPYVPELYRIPFGSAGQRTLVVTVTTAGGGTVYLDWMADNLGQNNATGWFLAPFATKTMTEMYLPNCEAAVGNTVDQLSSDGLNAFKVDLRPVCYDANRNPACNQSGDGIHPNDAGMAIIANEFIRRLNEITVSNQDVAATVLGSTVNATLSVTFGSAATLGSVSILTQGAPNLDFQATQTGTTCTVNTAYAVGANCTVGVGFTPRFSGMRIGAVVVDDDSGNLLATGYLQGIAQGPRIIFTPGNLTVEVSSLGRPDGVAVDGSGSLYIADSETGNVYKETVSGGAYSQSRIASGIGPHQLAVDGAGNLYIADSNSEQVLKEAPFGGAFIQSTIKSGLYDAALSFPQGVAVDGSGNVYIGDTNNNHVLQETLWDGIYSQSTVRSGLSYPGATGLSGPRGVAVDGSGNVYIADTGNDRIVKETLSQPGYTEGTVTGGLNSPGGVAVDGSGNVYIADTGNDRVLMETRLDGSYVQTTLANGLNSPHAVAVDTSGKVYIADSGNGRVLKIDLYNPPSLSFASSTLGLASAAQQITLTNAGNSTLSIGSIAITGAGASSFVFSNNCGSSLAIGATCLIHGHFTPAVDGVQTAAITITDNAGSSPQSIVLSGIGPGPMVSLSTSSLAFGSANVGMPSTSQSVTMTNTGNRALSTTSIGVTGSNASLFVFANDCPATLAAGASCTLHGHFTPASPGPLTSAVTIAGNAGNLPQSIVLSGTGLGPIISLSASHLSFGSVMVGTTSASQSVTLTNTGNRALSISGITGSGSNSSSFAFANSCGTSLAAGANCTIHGHFAPTKKGSLIAAVTIADNFSNLRGNIALGGTGLEPAVSLSARSLSFGGAKVGGSTTSQWVTLTNTGGATLLIGSIQIAGSGASSFVFGNNCGSRLAAGSTCRFHGHLTPVQAGSLSAAITIIDNADDSPERIQVTGTGLAPAAGLSQTSLPLGPQAVGTTSASRR